MMVLRWYEEWCRKVTGAGNYFLTIFTTVLSLCLKGFSFQCPALSGAGFPGCSSCLKAGCSEIKPVEPGQGNACEGKELEFHLSQQHFPLIF